MFDHDHDFDKFPSLFDPDDENEFFKRHRPTMTPWTIFCIMAGVFVMVICIALCCCRRKRNRGQVLTAAVIPPPPPGPTNPPYPQQQYGMPVQVPYPPPQNMVYTQAAPYPVGVGYPTSLPPTTQYPGAPKPAAPYPTEAPYPVAGYSAPTAPDCNAFYAPAPPGWTQPALPPSYDQAVAHEGYSKHPPYNPNAPR